MGKRLPTDAEPSEERVHLEKCKICGEWINRLSLDEVVRHLDHSRGFDPHGGLIEAAAVDNEKRPLA